MPHALLFRFYLFLLVLLVVMVAVSGRSRETRTRGWTLIALLHVVVVALWLGAAAWTVLAGVIAVLVAWELGGGTATGAAAVVLALGGGAAVLLLHLPAVGVAAVAWVLAGGMLVLPARAVRHPAFAAAVAVGLVGPCAAFLAQLGWHRPPAALLALVLLVEFNDAFAYLAGRRFGRTRIFPTTSPNKSLEGYAVGAVALVLGLVLLHTLLPALPAQGPLARGAVIFAVALFAADAGDLAAAAFKRRRGIKDSGRLLPGHGGALDRFGNLLLAAPLFAVLWAAGVL